MDHQLEFDTVQVRQFLLREKTKDFDNSEAELSPEEVG
jgi:hypothetical protein